MIDSASAGDTGKVRPLTLADIDRRTRSYQAAERLLGDLVSDLGGESMISAAERELARRAAAMGAMIEHTEALWLRGESIVLSEHLAAVNAYRRVLCSLGLERRAKPIGGLGDILRGGGHGRSA